MIDEQPPVDGMSELSLSSSENGQQQRQEEQAQAEASTLTGPTSNDTIVDALVDPSPERNLPAPSSVPASNGISSSVAEIYKPESSDGSTSVLDTTPIPPSAPSESASSQSHSLDPKLQAIAAIKCRDFAASPPPVRPAPTTTGQALSTGVHANGIKGLASAPAVQTLASTPASSTSSSSSSQDMALSTSAPESGASTPTATATATMQQPTTRPTPTSRPSQLGTGAGAGAVRRPGQGGSAGLATRIPPSLQAKMAAMASRSNNPTSINLAQNTHLGAGERIQTSSLFKPSSSSSSSSSSSATGGFPSLASRPSMAPPGAPGRVGAAGPASSSAVPQSRGPMMGGGMAPPGGGLARRRGPGAGLTLGGMGGGGGNNPAGPPVNGINGAGAAPPGRMNRPKMQLPGGVSGDSNGAGPSGTNGAPGSGAGGGAGGKGAFSNFSKIVDPSGSLNFQNKAVLHAKGVDFSNGSSFNINMDELQLQDELGSGAYGTVQKVYHKVTKVTMAMKEIRLELDDSKLKGIITELDILHRATAPEIVDFYGAFFIEGCVYYCMEYMDAGSLDRFAGCPIPEPVLQRVTASIVKGLKFLKDELQTMHRDIKPTNVLVNTAGAIKLCDFGVSGQLERSLAKTNIGCQSYMAPERIKGESLNFLGTYTVASDVWSLGLCIIEFCVGHYPYPPETYSNVFAQLQAIVHGDPPGLPDGYSKAADDFVAGCLQKDANKRPNYGQMLQHPFLKDEATLDIDMQAWVKECLEIRARNKAAALAGSAPSTPAAAAPLA